MIEPVKVPKWGLSMSEGTIVDWHKAPCDAVRDGDDLVDIETAKITNVAAAAATGVLRRILAQSGTTLRVGALIGIIADAEVPDGEIDAFVADFEARFGAADADDIEEAALVASTVETRLGPVRLVQSGIEGGTPVIFIHGFASDKSNWAFNMDVFGEDRIAYAIDLPGHGESTKNVGDGSIATLAEAVQDVIDRLGLDRVAMVGHSLGAAVALKVAEARPEAIGPLVLISPAGLGGGIDAAFLDGLIRARRPRELKSVLEMLVADPARVTTEMVEGIIRFKRVDGVAEALESLRARMIDGSQFDGLRDIAAHVGPVIIAGAEDRIVGGLSVEALPEGVALHIVRDAGHMPHVEQSSRVNAELKSAIG